MSELITNELYDIIYRNQKLLIVRYIVTDYFEMGRLVEDLAKIYSTACATSWFKVLNYKRPSKDEFRIKVVEFMKHFEYTLSTYPQSEEAGQLRDVANKMLKLEIEKVLAGENKEVERRYKYYVDYS